MNKSIKYSYYPKESEFSTGYYENKRSKFYSYVYNVNDVSEIEEILGYIKKENKRS